MSLNLLDCVQGHTDYDQQSCSSKIEGNVKSSIEDGGKDADGRDIDGPPKSDSGEHPVNIFSGLLTGSDPRDVTAKLLHIFGYIIWVEGDRRIKIAEEDDESHIEKIIERCARP